MTHELRWPSLSFCLLAACAADDGATPAPPGPPLPGMEDTAELRTARPASPGTTVSCLTRYDFSGSIPDAECTTALVGGDPLHWITTCPDHPDLTLEMEKQVNQAGDPLLVSYRGTTFGFVSRYAYDEQGRLTTAENDADDDGVAEWTKTVTEYDAEGRPLEAAILGPILDIATENLPAVEQRQTSVYDGEGRLTHDEIVLVSDGTVLDSTSIVYDDDARRRRWELAVDLRPAIPEATAVIEVDGFDVFDEENRPVTYHWAPSDPVIEIVYQYRYDEEGRLLATTGDRPTTPGDGGRLQFVAHEVYDCP